MTLIMRGLSICSRNLLKNNRHNVILPITTLNQVSSRTFSTGQRMKGIFKLGLAGITVGALVGTGYSIHQMNKPRLHIINEETAIETIKEIPKIEPSRQIKYDNDNSGLKLTLYQYQTCPFCCKVRAFLDYHGISYDVVEVDPVLRQSIKWSPYKKVPILVANVPDGYQPLNDSSMIVSALCTYLKDSEKELPEIVKCYPHIAFVDDDGVKKTDIMNKYFVMLGKPTNYEDTNEERKWRKWADDVFVHTLSPNVYRTREEALQAFNWFSEVGEWSKNFPSWEENLIIYVGASAMWLIGKRLKKKYNLKDDVRQSLYDECNHWARSVKKTKGKFMGGDRPNLADITVYGYLSSIEGCNAFKDILDNSRIGNWYFSMKESVKNHDGAKFV